MNNFVIIVPSTCCKNSNLFFKKALASSPLTPTKGPLPLASLLGVQSPDPPFRRTTFKFAPTPLLVHKEHMKVSRKSWAL